MFKQWVEKLVSVSPGSAGSSTGALDMRQISTQLLMEVARSDADISDDERQKIIDTVVSKSGLSSDALDDLLDSAEQAVDESTSFYQHVRLINEHFSREQKIELIEQMWQVAYADNSLDEYEEAFIRQIADLIHVRHREFMKAKLRVTGQ